MGLSTPMFLCTMMQTRVLSPQLPIELWKIIFRYTRYQGWDQRRVVEEKYQRTIPTRTCSTCGSWPVVPHICQLCQTWACRLYCTFQITVIYIGKKHSKRNIKNPRYKQSQFFCASCNNSGEVAILKRALEVDIKKTDRHASNFHYVQRHVPAFPNC